MLFCRLIKLNVQYVLVKDILWTCYGHIMDMLETYKGHVRDIYKGHVWDMLETFKEHETCSGNVRGKFHPGFYVDSQVPIM